MTTYLQFAATNIFKASTRAKAARRVPFFIFLLLFLGGTLPSLAGDEEDARKAAQIFNSRFDANQMNQLYADFAGEFIRSKVTKDAFVSQLTVLRSQLGGPARERTRIQQTSGPEPTTGQLGYSFRYKATFPMAVVYQDLTLIKEATGSWKLYGIFFNPVPSE
jgi:Protein of unknown function (DUF4019)